MKVKNKIVLLGLELVLLGTCMMTARQIDQRNEVERLIYDGIEKCEKETIRRALDKGADINKLIYHMQVPTSPLEIACTHCNTEFVSFLIDNGADMNLQSGPYRGGPPLFRKLIKEKVKELVKLFIMKGANTDKINPLVEAIEWGDLEIIQLLFERGAQVNPKKPDDPIPLFSAIWQKNLSGIKILIKYGANINIRQEDPRYVNDTPLHIAVSKQYFNPEIVHYLIECGANLEAGDDAGVRPLAEAVMDGPIEAIEILLKAGADPNPKGKADNKPLFWAAYMKRWDVVDLLRNNGAREQDVPESEIPSLHWAVMMDRAEEVKSLLIKVNDINQIDFEGRTAVFWASHHDRREILKLLLEKGANPNISDQDRQNAPLHVACSVEAQDMLHRFGANMYAKNINGELPAFIAARDKDAKMLQALLKWGVHVNTSSKYNYSLLHFAVIGKNIQTAKLLLSKGANIDAQTSNGDTPLHLAIFFSNIEMIKLLCEQGASLTIKNEFGDAMEYAEYCDEKKEEVKTVLKHYYKINIGK